MRMQRVDYRAGDVVIKQGDEGDYFYVIVKGRCTVTRETPLNKEGIKLAELGMGDTFGEEALISEAQAQRHRDDAHRRHADASRQAGFHARCSTSRCSQWVDYDAGAADRREGRQVAGRPAAERVREHAHRRGASTCRCTSSASSSRRSTQPCSYVVCCDTGRRSSAGAYILSERGFDAHVLKGGLGATDVVKPRRG